jgi:MFS transporter, DHA2 family, multidrug resistance protein
MLDLSLFAAPVFSVGLLMAFVASGAMAGFELVLAQELQYVFGKTPLEAGLFMLPLAAASAAVSPFSGMLTERFGLRAVATASMGAAAASFFLLGRVSVDASPIIAAALLGLLGTALGCGLLASSVAIMSSAPTDKAGAAGSLEATGYELGAGLGVTFFGVLLGAAYHSHFSGAMGVLGGVPATAANSINDAMTAAQTIGGAEGGAIIATATRALSSAHQTVLGAAALLLGALTILVFCALRHAPRPPAPQR